MKGNKHIKSFNEHKENLSDVSNSNYTSVNELEYDIETRPYGDPDGKIYICLFHQNHFKYDNLDDHDTIYKIDNYKFHQEFRKLPYVKGEYNNEYTPINFTTEKECIDFLNSIGLKKV